MSIVVNMEEINNRIVKEVKNEKIVDARINERGNVVIKTKVFSYECILKESNGKVSFKMKPSAHPAFYIGAIVGLFTAIPLIAVLVIALLNEPVRKDIKRQIENIIG